jgi:hypothetical protein
MKRIITSRYLIRKEIVCPSIIGVNGIPATPHNKIKRGRIKILLMFLSLCKTGNNDFFSLIKTRKFIKTSATKSNSLIPIKRSLLPVRK